MVGGFAIQDPQTLVRVEHAYSSCGDIISLSSPARQFRLEVFAAELEV
jgi:hypothetical protein